MRDLLRAINEMAVRGSWSRFITLFALLLPMAVYKFVTDWSGVARLLVVDGVLVLIAIGLELLNRRV
jgi:hypothetical protein